MDDRIRRAREGDRDALQALLAENRDRILRFVTAMLGDPHEAEDILQSTWEEVPESLTRFEGRSAFSTWLYRIALNKTRRVLRDKARHAKLADPETMDAATAAPRGVLSSIYRRELAGNIEIAIDQLPPQMKEAFILRHLEGMEFEEMAQILDATVNTLYVRSHRARQLLKGSLGPVVDTYWKEDAR